MAIDLMGIIVETFKYMIAGFAGAYMSIALELNGGGQYIYVGIASLFLFVLVVSFRIAIPYTQEELLEETVRETVEDTVPQAVRDSVQEELQSVDHGGND